MLFTKVYKINSKDFRKKRYMEDAVKTLVAAGIDARMDKAGGVVHGYVVGSKKTLAAAIKVLEGNKDVSINEIPVDIQQERIVLEFNKKLVK